MWWSSNKPTYSCSKPRKRLNKVEKLHCSALKVNKRLSRKALCPTCCSWNPQKCPLPLFCCDNQNPLCLQLCSTRMAKKRPRSVGNPTSTCTKCWVSMHLLILLGIVLVPCHLDSLTTGSGWCEPELECERGTNRGEERGDQVTHLNPTGRKKSYKPADCSFKFGLV